MDILDQIAKLKRTEEWAEKLEWSDKDAATSKDLAEIARTAASIAMSMTALAASCAAKLTDNLADDGPQQASA